MWEILCAKTGRVIDTVTDKAIQRTMRPAFWNRKGAVAMAKAREYKNFRLRRAELTREAAARDPLPYCFSPAISRAANGKCF